MKINIKKYKIVKSTNDIALKLIKNITKPTLVTTEKQTNGRGKWGKNGFQRKESFYIIIFKFDQKKINSKKFAILNAILLKKLFQK